jgi:ABC-2 type transport system ATP-binding protein
MQQEPIVQVEHLRKTYGATVAVDGISFQVCKGEIFGIVGPNGAGKTTTIECIEGLRRPDGGHIRVFGLDPHQDGYACARGSGYNCKSRSCKTALKVWEALDLFASFYPRAVEMEASPGAVRPGRQT